MSTDEANFVTQLNPLDVTGVQDDGIKCLCVLAASLGWNVRQKVNQPIVLTSRQGLRKSFPTNTSVRMSVFQQGISTILAYTDYDTVPTIELIDAIIASVKPSVDHQRRLRLAVGETPAQHRERLANDKVGVAREPEPVTQRIEVPFVDTPEFAELEWVEPPTETGEHGALVSREPYMAMRQKHRNRASYYQSDTSYERVWEDGFKDYECMVCGRAFATPRGVGGHIQTHEGREHTEQPAWVRAGGTFTVVDPEPEPVVEQKVDLVAAAESLATLKKLNEGVEELTFNDIIVQKITELVAPSLVEVIADRNARIAVLGEERDLYKKRYEKARGDLQALRALIVEAGGDED